MGAISTTCHHATEIESNHADTLLAQLNATVKSGKFYMDITTGLELGAEATTTAYYIDIQYDHVAGGDAFILLGWGDGPTVKWVDHEEEGGETRDTFEFRGPIRVGIKGVTGEKGKKSNRTIACGGVAITITW